MDKNRLIAYIEHNMGHLGSSYPSLFRPKLDLQLFADGAGDGAGGDGGGDSGGGNLGGDGSGQGAGDDEGNGKDKTFTQDELNRILGERLSQAQAKWDKDLQSRLEAAKTEAEKLAKMNAEQKAQYEREKRETELAKREGEITRRELRATALESLAEKGLPKQLAELLNYTDAESTQKSLEAAEKAFREAVEAGVNERLKGSAPKGGGGAGNTDQDEIAKIFARR